MYIHIYVYPSIGLSLPLSLSIALHTHNPHVFGARSEGGGGSMSPQSQRRLGAPQSAQGLPAQSTRGSLLLPRPVKLTSRVLC